MSKNIRCSSPAKSAKQWHCYILECADKTYYTGSTNDVDRRIEEHRSGKGGAYTRARLPVTMVYREPHPSRSAAQSREALIKRMRRSNKQALIRETNRGAL